MSRPVALALIAILAASSLIAIAPIQAKIVKPIVPEFSVKYMNNSYDVSANVSTDPITGKPILLKAGYRVENNSIELVIKNQPFTSYSTENGSLVELFYNIRFKGHLESDWHQVKEDAIGWNNYILCLPLYLPSSNSEYTTHYFSVRTHYLDYSEESRYRFTVGNEPILNFTSGDQVDFQVMAMIGYYTQFSDGMTPYGEAHHYTFTGENSGWSNTQTVAIGETAAITAIPSQTTQTEGRSNVVGEQVIIAVLAVVVIAALAVIVLRRRRNHKNAP